MSTVPHNENKKHILYHFFKAGSSKKPENDKFHITLNGDNSLKITGSPGCHLISCTVIFKNQHTIITPILSENSMRFFANYQENVNNYEVALNQIRYELLDINLETEKSEGACALVRFFDDNLLVLYSDSTPFFYRTFHNELQRIKFADNKEYILRIFPVEKDFCNFHIWSVDCDENYFDYLIDCDNRVAFDQISRRNLEISPQQEKSFRNLQLLNEPCDVIYDPYTQTFKQKN